MGLELLSKLEADERIAQDHRLHAVRAHLLEMAGDRTAARARNTRLRLGEQPACHNKRYLNARAAQLTDDD